MKTTNVLLGLIVVALIIVGIVMVNKPKVQAPTQNIATTTETATEATANPSIQDKTKMGTAPVTKNNQFTGVDSEGNAVIGDGPIPATIAHAQQANIAIKNFAYVNASDNKPVVGTFPGNVEIIWTNNDSMAHTVTFDDGSVDSGLIAPGKTFAYYFTKPGTYAYHCAYHPNMKASLSIGKAI